MEKQIRLTPEELYFMASLMGAKYIDYAYIAAMNDIQQNYDLYKRETQASLVEKGILDEDFSGNVEISAQAKALLSPIFFGTFESSVDICYIKEDARRVEVNKFHFLDGQVIHVEGKEKELIITSIGKEELHKFAERLISDNYKAESKELDEGIQPKDVTRVLAVKNIDVAKKNEVKVFADANGIICCETAEGKFMQLDADTFINTVFETIWRA